MHISCGDGSWQYCQLPSPQLVCAIHSRFERKCSWDTVRHAGNWMKPDGNPQLYCSFVLVDGVYVACWRCLCHMLTVFMSHVAACLRCLCRMLTVFMSHVDGVYVACCRLFSVFMSHVDGVHVACWRCLCCMLSLVFVACCRLFMLSRYMVYPGVICVPIMFMGLYRPYEFRNIISCYVRYIRNLNHIA